MEYTNKILKNFKTRNLLISYMVSKNKFQKFSEIPKITKIKVKIPIKKNKINFLCYITGIFFLLFGKTPHIKKTSKKLDLELNFYNNLLDFALPFSLLFFSTKNEQKIKISKINKILISFKIRNLFYYYPVHNLYFHLLQNIPSFDLLILISTNSNKNSKFTKLIVNSAINLKSF